MTGVTVLDSLIAELRARDLANDGEARPAAILWTDPGNEWSALRDLLRERVPEFLTLGDYEPARRTGPAIWLRCMIERALEQPAMPPERTPILYLPGVARQDLRAGEHCREELRPLVELMFRGTMWLHPNGNDWTVSAFLTSPRTLGLEIARDRATMEALLRALPEVALIRVADLRGRTLESEDFDRLLVDDPLRNLLRWIGDPDGTRTRLDAPRWAAFRARVGEELGFDPERETTLTAGERLGRGDGEWARVWERYREAPGAYPGVVDLLKRSRPSGELFPARDRWPDINDGEEERLRGGLEALLAMPHALACGAVQSLEAEHAERRDWVWAGLGLAPLAQVLEPLAVLAREAQTPLGGSKPDDVAEAYRSHGWIADASSWRALAMASAREEALVSNVVRHILLPWLDDSARALQASASRFPLPRADEQPVIEAGEDCCLLFADGLRYDLAQVLAERLEGRGCHVLIGHRWAALPTVTATAKPAVTPIATALDGRQLQDDFAPVLRTSGRPAGAAELREAIATYGYQVLADGAPEPPIAEGARGWVECGRIDSDGHKLGARLAGQLSGELDRIAERIMGLLAAGWRRVRIVTDHGWLLVPGGLDKVDLPRHLTECRWARCAVIRGESTPDVPRWPWYWNGTQWFAAAPGVACFNRGEEYSHGGISIQECLTPDLVVERTEDGAHTVAAITAITWRGLRCFIEATVRGGAVKADLRLGVARGESVVAAAKPVEPDGFASLVLVDDTHEGSALVLVLLDAHGQIIAQRPTQTGMNS